MTEIVTLSKKRIDGITYNVQLDKKEKKITIFAEKGSDTRTITINSNKGERNIFDNKDEIKISGAKIKLDVGYLNGILAEIFDKKYTEIKSEDFTDIDPSHKRFNPTQHNKNMKTLNELGIATTTAYNETSGKPKPQGYQYPYRGYDPTGGPYYVPSASYTTQKPLSDDALAYKKAISTITARKQALENQINNLNRRLPKVIEQAQKFQRHMQTKSMSNPCFGFGGNITNPCQDAFFYGYIGAGNGNPVDMYNKFQAELNQLCAELTQLNQEEASLNDKYKHVIDEVNNSNTHTYQGGWRTPPNPWGANQPNAPTKPTFDIEEDDENEEEDDKVGKNKKPENLDEAKNQVESLTKTLDDIETTDKEINGEITALKNTLNEIQDKLKNGEISLEEAQKKIEEAKTKLKEINEKINKAKEITAENISEDRLKNLGFDNDISKRTYEFINKNKKSDEAKTLIALINKINTNEKYKDYAIKYLKLCTTTQDTQDIAKQCKEAIDGPGTDEGKLTTQINKITKDDITSVLTHNDKLITDIYDDCNDDSDGTLKTTYTKIFTSIQDRANDLGIKLSAGMISQAKENLEKIKDNEDPNDKQAELIRDALNALKDELKNKETELKTKIKKELNEQ